MTDDLLARLGSVLRRCDPVPSSVIAAAEAAFVAYGCGFGVLERVVEPALVRSGSRRFRFGDNEVSVCVSVDRSGLSGLVSPVADVEVCWPAGARRIRPDRAGFFHLPEVPPGPLRVVVAGCRATRWFLP